MRLLTFLRFYREIRKEGPADLDWIQKQGLLAVKLSQIFALRPDMLSIEKCRQLQKMYRNASTIPSEDVERILKEKAPSGFYDSIAWFDEEPLAAASVGQVHRATLTNGEEVVIKVVKADHKERFPQGCEEDDEDDEIGHFTVTKTQEGGEPSGTSQTR